MARIRVFGILIVFLALSFSNAYGQKVQLSIEVRNEKREAFEFASIFISPCECGGTTDGRGTFVIDLEKDRYRIITSSLGYESDTLSILLEKATGIEITLADQNYLLSKVVISAQNNNDRIERALMGVEQISAAKIKTLPTTLGEVDVLKSLTLLPGVGSAGEASNGLSIRGGSLDQNLVLLDHAPIFNPTHLFGLFSAFTPEAVSNVSIYKSNIPSKFGGRVSSVVDIRSKSPNSESFKLSGGVGLISSNLGIETPVIKDKLDFMLMARGGFNDFLFPLVGGLEDTRANFWDTTLKLKFTPNSKSRFEFTGFASKDFYEIAIISKINNIAATSNQYDYLTVNGTLNWLYTLSEHSFLRTTVVNSEYRPKILFPQLESESKIEYGSVIRNRKLQIEYLKEVGPRWTYAIGTELNQIHLSPGSLSANGIEDLDPFDLADERGLESAAYANIELDLTEKFAFSVGLRYSYYFLLGPYNEAQYEDGERNRQIGLEVYETNKIVQTYDGLEPRFGMRYSLTTNASLKVSYALTRQYLQNIYNSTTPVPTSRWKTADRYIKPQIAHSYSAGYFQNLMEGSYSFSIEGYYREIANVLDYKPGADFFLNEFVESEILQGIGRNYGAEFSFEKLSGKWNGWANYTYSKSIRKFEAVQVRNRINQNQWFNSDFDRPHVFNGTISCKANEFNTFSLSFTYQTGRPYTLANAIVTINEIDVPVFLERNNGRIPDFHRLDFSWNIHNITTKKDRRWKGDWVVTIYNIYGRKNAFNRYYGDLADGKYGLIFGDNLLGSYQLSIFSSPIISLNYKFTFQ